MWRVSEDHLLKEPSVHINEGMLDPSYGQSRYEYSRMMLNESVNRHGLCNLEQLREASHSVLFDLGLETDNQILKLSVEEVIESKLTCYTLRLPKKDKDYWKFLSALFGIKEAGKLLYLARCISKA